MQKKRNFLHKLWLRFNNPTKYCKEYKGMDFVHKEITPTGHIIRSLGQSMEEYKPEMFKNRADDFDKRIKHNFEHNFESNPENVEFYSFKQSGHTGDLIYCLPSLIALAGGKKANFYIDITLKSPYKAEELHPSGNTTMNKKMVDMLSPLLLAQDYIKNVEIYDTKKPQKLDYDFDMFRQMPIIFNRGYIARWYSYMFGEIVDLSKPWIKVTPNLNYKDYIILTRTARYNNPHINYSFLQKYKNIVFLGLEIEFELMKKHIPKLVYHPVNDFLEMAEIIAGCKFFIGNQSFSYSLADAMNIPRILEVYYDAPTPIPGDAKCFDFYFQKHFELLVEKLNT